MTAIPSRHNQKHQSAAEYMFLLGPQQQKKKQAILRIDEQSRAQMCSSRICEVELCQLNPRS